jgi:hypothetical protein
VGYELRRVTRLQDATKDDRLRLDALGSALDSATERLKVLVTPKRDAFLLEKQPNISVYCLHVPISCPGCHSIHWQPSVTVNNKSKLEVLVTADMDGFSGCGLCGRTAYSVTLTLATDVEAEKFTASVDRDGILVRMPFYYPGSVKTAHASSNATTVECDALKSPTSRLCCRWLARVVRPI